MQGIIGVLVLVALGGAAWAKCDHPFYPVREGWVWTYRSSPNNNTLNLTVRSTSWYTPNAGLVKSQSEQVVIELVSLKRLTYPSASQAHTPSANKAARPNSTLNTHTR